jgi:predicted ester cyclase
MRPRAPEAILRDTRLQEEQMSQSEANKSAVRDCFENAARGNFDALHSIVTPDYVIHPEGVHGPDGLAEMVQGYRDALAGLNVTIEHQFTEGDYVATRSTIRGRHDGELMGTPPSGRDVEFTSLTISRCRDGKIEEEWELVDVVGLLQQVGALPASPPAAAAPAAG